MDANSVAVTAPAWYLPWKGSLLGKPSCRERKLNVFLQSDCFRRALMHRDLRIWFESTHESTLWRTQVCRQYAYSCDREGRFQAPQAANPKMLISIRILATKLKILENIQKLNLRPGGGGSFWPHQLLFRKQRKNGGAQRRRCFAYLFIHQFRTIPENFSPRSSQVRSPGQVKCPYLQKIFMISPWLQFLMYQYETFRSW